VNSVLLLLDGIGDRPWPELDGMTPLEAAHTPNLDRIAEQGATGIMHALGPGRAPGSELAHWALFGYPMDLYPGRAVFEAAAAGIPLESSQVAVHGTTVMARPQGDGSLTIVDRGHVFHGEMVVQLLADMDRFEHQGLQLQAREISDTDFVYAISGPASPDITDTDPHNLGWPLGRATPLADATDPAAAARTAAAINAALDELWNRVSALAEPDEDVPFVVLKWPGRRAPLPPFAEHTGMSGHVVSAGGVYAGIAKELGMKHTRVAPTGDVTTDLEVLLAQAAEALTSGAEFVHIHDKDPDKAGHEKDPALKRDVIAQLDSALGEVASGALFGEDTVLVVTGDHGTPAGTELIHSGDPVPIVIRTEAVAADQVDRYSERGCAHGSLGMLQGQDLMPMLLNARGTTRYLSGRLSPITGLHWPRPGEYPAYRVPGQGKGKG
jgi:2,3-bisphosphoglycerate-independent phosphoglycerate mutase